MNVVFVFCKVSESRHRELAYLSITEKFVLRSNEMNRLLSTLSKNGSERLPKIATFDLDHTVWPFGIDSFQFIPPFYFHQGKLIDNNSQEIKHFPDFPKIFEILQSKNIQVAVASRTKYPTGAYRLIELFDWQKYISYYQIYPGKKVKHFERIRQESGVNFEDMIFFDDEERNIMDIGQIGVHTVFVDGRIGATKSIVLESLAKFCSR